MSVINGGYRLFAKAVVAESSYALQRNVLPIVEGKIPLEAVKNNGDTCIGDGGQMGARKLSFAIFSR